MAQGKVTAVLAGILRRAVEDRGIVVWYDPEGAYRNSLSVLAVEGAELLVADEGFFRLRQTMEPFLEFVDGEGKMKDEAHLPPRLLVYVPKERASCGYALVEAETAGCVLEPGATAPERDTRLSSLVRSVFSETAPLKAEDLAQKADQGTFSLEEFDTMAEEGTGGTPETLALIFENRSGAEILLHFAASGGFDARLLEKNALGDIILLAASETGLQWTGGDDSPASFRSALSRHLLLSEFLSFMTEGNRPSELAKLSLPEDRIRIETIRSICSSWRKRADLKESYKSAASDIEASHSLDGIALPLESLEECETFPVVEKQQLDRCSRLVLDGMTGEALELVGKRRSRFWASEDPEFTMLWSVAESASTLRERARGVLSASKKKTPSFQDAVLSYVSGEEPWMLLDRASRQLESRYARVESDGDLLMQLVHSARADYARAVHELASVYAGAFTAWGGETPPGIMAHCSVFRNAVRPLLEDGKREEKTAYFLVDALRYEMAEELAGGFDDGSEVSLRPVLGVLPGITSVGMAALLPGAENGLSLEKKSESLSVVLDGKAVNSRNARMDHVRTSLDVPVAVMKLGDAVKLTPKRKKEVESARLVVVTSQEIDHLGEEGADEEETRTYMDDVLGKIHRAVRSLGRCGVTRFIITADHGFQLVSAEEPGLAMDPPGGETLLLHPRVWIGRGGRGDDGFIRRSASEIGLGGELELAFPKGLAVFRTKGGAGLYFHGGISPQEHILPLLSVVVSGQGPNESTSGMKISLSMAKQRVTNRIFMVTITSEPSGLFPAEEKKVRLEITSGKAEAGLAVTAAYGFDEALRELSVEVGRPNSVTVMLSGNESPGRITISVLDTQSQVVLDALRDVPVDLM